MNACAKHSVRPVFTYCVSNATHWPSFAAPMKSVAIDTVSEIEDLTGNLSRKIWQKIMILREPATKPG